MNWNRWMRWSHRCLSIAFTLVVVVNGVEVVRGKYNNRMGLVAVATLALQFLTGMYLFVLPYVAKWRGGRLSD